MKLIAMTFLVSIVVPIYLVKANPVQDTPLMSAVKKGDLVAVQELINNKVKLNEQNSKGYTALMYAALYENFAIVQALIKAGAHVDIQSNSGHTALLFAGSKAMPIVMALIDAHADIDTQEWMGNTALMVAIKNNDKPMVHYLIAQGARLTSINKEKNTPLLLARPYDSEISTLLLDAEKVQAYVFAQVKRLFPVPGLKQTDPIMYSTMLNEARLALQRVKKLAQEHVIVNYSDAWGNSPIHCAINAGNRPMVVLLLSLMFQAKRGESMIKCNDAGFTPLDIAVLKAPTSILPLLVTYASL